MALVCAGFQFALCPSKIYVKSELQYLQMWLHLVIGTFTEWKTGPNPIQSGVPEEEEISTQTHTGGRPYEDTRWQTPGKPRRSLRRGQSCQHLGLRHLASKTEKISVVEAWSSVVKAVLAN